MDFKKSNTPLNTVTRDLIELSEQTGNIYETVCIISKRANQIVSETREQIEISRYYERLPKPTLIATQEYIDHKLFFRKSNKDRSSL